MVSLKMVVCITVALRRVSGGMNGDRRKESVASAADDEISARYGCCGGPFSSLHRVAPSF
jgi:hypothetical protein